MIFDIWMRIAYIIQLMGACIIFMLPARKRSYFWLRITILSAVLIPLSYLLDYGYSHLNFGILVLVYWAYYIAAGILFVWTGMEGKWPQVVYCGICACAVQHIAFDIYLIYIISGGQNEMIMLLIYITVYALFYWFYAKRLLESGEYTASKKALFPIITIVILVWILSILEIEYNLSIASGQAHIILYRIIDALCCYYVLWVQLNQKENKTLQRERDGINNALEQQTKQYLVTRETIDSINRKCHDLKHQIRLLRQGDNGNEEFLNEIENEIMIYDTAVKTGNKALDIVLMEKGLFCKTHNIQWSCMADGSLLDFMKLEDIYAIFGNALDNAITAVLELEDIEMRVIGVKIWNQNHLLIIQIQNYYAQELKFEEGLPVTTKKNKRDHGYGMKSIRYTTEKYNGTITVNTKSRIFMLQILIPLNNSKKGTCK